MDFAQYKLPFIPKWSRTATSGVALSLPSDELKIRNTSLPTEKASHRMQPMRESWSALDFDTSHDDGKVTAPTVQPTAAWTLRPLRVAPGPSTIILLSCLYAPVGHFSHAMLWVKAGAMALELEHSDTCTYSYMYMYQGCDGRWRWCGVAATYSTTVARNSYR
jgi:hypothetical protein